MKQNKLKKISAFLPRDLLAEAIDLAQCNQTDTIISALTELVAKHNRIKVLKSLRKIHIDYDIDAVRQRRIIVGK